MTSCLDAQEMRHRPQSKVHGSSTPITTTCKMLMSNNEIIRVSVIFRALCLTAWHNNSQTMQEWLRRVVLQMACRLGRFIVDNPSPATLIFKPWRNRHKNLPAYKKLCCRRHGKCIIWATEPWHIYIKICKKMTSKYKRVNNLLWSCYCFVFDGHVPSGLQPCGTAP